ncbi:hypothetical protein AP057_12755 [Geobacillus sp. Sah69]|uniref:pyocin knob domain-containing protein n=1 Tax=Geobacillus sp. Sah69 TaxID=1737624 RepID=UPI0006DC5AB8|nr:tail fiber protein [Geobacillus sp. Sah69]KQC48538.1 hypothetical protein AP057_12755 [Geobacillus sp. Sah69]
MASNTPRLGLYKKDPIADANDTFNIQTMLNDNWDKIDGKVAILGPDGKILSEQLPQQSLPNASITQAGIVQLNDTLTSASTTQAATANAVKRVNDAVVAHSADTTKHVTQAEKDTWNSMQKHKVTADNGTAILISGQDLNNLVNTGFYNGDNLINSPDGSASWFYVEVIRHTNSANYVIQKAFKLTGTQPTFYMRIRDGGTWSAWSENLFTSVSDGKAQLESTITAKGGTVTKAGAVPTFAELVSGVKSIPIGKKFATGTITSSTSPITFYRSVDGYTFSYFYLPFSISAIGFFPSYILAKRTGDVFDHSIYDSRFPNDYKITAVGAKSNYGSVSGASLRMTNVTDYAAYFRLPVQGGGVNYDWIAFE